MSNSALQRNFPPMNTPVDKDDHEFVTYSEFRGFVSETRTGFVHLESKIDWLQSNMNIRFEAVNKRFDDFTTNIDKRFEAMDKRFDGHTGNINKRFEEFTANINKRFDEFTANINARFDDLNKRFDDANTKSHREFVGIMLGFLSINLVIIGSVVGLIAKTG
jgi:DNA anti-recombination protein RmuC